MNHKATNAVDLMTHWGVTCQCGRYLSGFYPDDLCNAFASHVLEEFQKDLNAQRDEEAKWPRL